MLNELAELNLLLLEKIYKTFENKGDKVLKQFRQEKWAYLRPRIVKYVGWADIDKGKGVDNASQSTIMLDGDEEGANLMGQMELGGRPMEGTTDYRIIQAEDTLPDLRRMLVSKRFVTADEARKQMMKSFDSDISLNFDTELEANLKFLDNLLGDNSVHSHNTSSILDGWEINF